MLPKVRGKLVSENLWMTTDDISHTYFLQAIKRGEIARKSVSRFTGYLDVRGEEIYEKDIVKDRAGLEYEVVVFRGEFVLDDHYECLKTFPTVGNEVEVIGNRYDNPDIFD